MAQCDPSSYYFFPCSSFHWCLYTVQQDTVVLRSNSKIVSMNIGYLLCTFVGFRGKLFVGDSVPEADYWIHRLTDSAIAAHTCDYSFFPLNFVFHLNYLPFWKAIESIFRFHFSVAMSKLCSQQNTMFWMHITPFNGWFKMLAKRSCTDFTFIGRYMDLIGSCKL